MVELLFEKREYNSPREGELTFPEQILSFLKLYE
jgi:hypothetical protein